jgi:iron complex outermembrane receptor protein
MKKSLILFILFQQILISQNNKLDTVWIGTQKVSSRMNAIQQISEQDIQKHPSITINDLFVAQPNVNIQNRGVLSSQSDISIRGGSYEQVGVLLNGIRINDPQTGHNTFSMPFLMEDIEKIDVYKSASSKNLGQNGYSGAIQFTTKKIKSDYLQANISLGSFQTFNSTLSAGKVFKNHWHRLSVGYLNSNGYRANTDMEAIQGFTEHHATPFKNKNVDLYALAGFVSKKFGANGFYSNRFPNQYEEIQSYFYNAGIQTTQSKIDFYWKQNNDYFVLRRENPNFYKNRHHNDSRGVLMRHTAGLFHQKAMLNLSGEYRNEQIHSSNLGDRNRDIFNANINVDFSLWDKLKLNIGQNTNYIIGFNPNITGGIQAAFLLNKNHSINGGVNTAFRIPTFTELYYTAPTDSGNAQLVSEDAINMELGYKFQSKRTSFSAQAYYRNSTNQIDWIKKTDNATFFAAANIGNVVVKGLETQVDFFLGDDKAFVPFEKVSFSYVHNELTSENLFPSKYNFNFLRNQAIGSLYLRYGKYLAQSLTLRIEDRPYLNKVFAVLDTKFEYDLSATKSKLFLSIYNLTNTQYQYFQDIPMPGIHFQAGMQFSPF